MSGKRKKGCSHKATAGALRQRGEQKNSPNQEPRKNGDSKKSEPIKNEEKRGNEEIVR